MVDIHTHVLFKIDDGPKTPEDSLALLARLAESGVSDVVATSHYYSHRVPVDRFLQSRNERLEQVRRMLDERDIAIRLYPAAEVYLDNLLFNVESLSELCFEGTNNLLLEISHTADSLEDTLQMIARVMSTYNVQPIIAHVERYRFFYKKMHNLRLLQDMGCLIQVDTDCVLGSLWERRFAFSALREGYVDVIASDCHDLKKRSPRLTDAYALIRKKAGDETVLRLQENARQLIVPTHTNIGKPA